MFNCPATSTPTVDSSPASKMRGLNSLRPLAALRNTVPTKRGFGFSGPSGGFGDDAFPVVRDALVPIVVEQTVRLRGGMGRRRGRWREGAGDYERRRAELTGGDEEEEARRKGESWKWRKPPYRWDESLTPGAWRKELRYLLATVARARHLPWRACELPLCCV